MTEFTVEPLRPETPVMPDAHLPTAHIDEQDIAYIQGRPHPMYRGLLKAAHLQGLVSLKTMFTFNSDTLALAQATALFTDGRVYCESADATPTNVSKMVAPHFRRMALTRAKSRVLRDALGIGEASFEEVQGAEAPAESEKPVLPAVPDMAGTPPAIPRCLATELIADTLPDGRTIFKVCSDDFPANRRNSARYPGIPIYEQGLNASGFHLESLDPDFLPDIAGWEVRWETFQTKAGKESQRVTKLIPAHAAAANANDDDIPF